MTFIFVSKSERLCSRPAFQPDMTAKKWEVKWSWPLTYTWQQCTEFKLQVSYRHQPNHETILVCLHSSINLASKSAISLNAYAICQHEISLEVYAGSIQKQVKPTNSHFRHTLISTARYPSCFRDAAVTTALCPLGVSWPARLESRRSCRIQGKMRGNTGNLKGIEPQLQKKKKTEVCCSSSATHVRVSSWCITQRQKNIPREEKTAETHYVF